MSGTCRADHGLISHGADRADVAATAYVAQSTHCHCATSAGSHIAARAQTQGLPAAAGYIEAALALGSVTGGLLWGRRRHTRTHWTHLAGLIGVLAIGIAICAAVTSLTTLGTLMAVMGLAIAPLFVVSYLAADELAPEHQQTEASTWVNTANNIGSAAGASVAGLLIDRASISVGFAAGGVILGLTSVLIWLTHRSIQARSGTCEAV